MRDLSNIETDDELWARWLTCPWVREFERGGCSPEDFATGMVDEWELEISAATFLDAFAGWLGGPMPGAEDLVDDVRRVVPTGCLSNTNALHWQRHAAEWQMVKAFEYRFLSFELGVVKPDRDLFERVASLLPVPRERVLFLDDNPPNVEGASAAGFGAVRARGVDEARQALITAGVLAS